MDVEAAVGEGVDRKVGVMVPLVVGVLRGVGVDVDGFAAVGVGLGVRTRAVTVGEGVRVGVGGMVGVGEGGMEVAVGAGGVTVGVGATAATEMGVIAGGINAWAIRPTRPRVCRPEPQINHKSTRTPMLMPATQRSARQGLSSRPQ